MFEVRVSEHDLCKRGQDVYGLESDSIASSVRVCAILNCARQWYFCVQRLIVLSSIA